MLAHLVPPRMLVPALACAWLCGVGCSDDGKPDVSHPAGDAGATGGSGGDGGKPDGSGGNGGSDAGTDADAGDAAPSPLRLGIIPVPPHSSDAGPSAADEKLAHLDVIALGSRGISQVLPWRELYDSPTTPVAAEWARVAALAQTYRTAGRSLLVCLALVDRTLDARPSGSASSWNDSATRTALEAFIDQTLATHGSELYALSFGDELDRYFAAASVKNANELAALVEHGIAYARQKSPSLHVGATFGHRSLSGPLPASVSNIIAKSDVIVATYHPLDTSFVVQPPTTVSQDLDALPSLALGDAEPPRPVLLQAVGYPSAAANKSSPEQQKAFFQALTQALDARRERFPFVSIDGLNDRHPAACESEAAAFGAPGNAAAIAARCSLGLRGPGASAKPALASVLAALAAFSTP